MKDEEFRLRGWGRWVQWQGGWDAASTDGLFYVQPLLPHDFLAVASFKSGCSQKAQTQVRGDHTVFNQALFLWMGAPWPPKVCSRAQVGYGQGHAR